MIYINHIAWKNKLSGKNWMSIAAAVPHQLPNLALPATQPCRPLSLAGHSALPATQPCRPLSLAGHSALPATQPCRPLSLAGHSALPATQPCRPLSLAGHSALPATQPILRVQIYLTMRDCSYITEYETKWYSNN